MIRFFKPSKGKIVIFLILILIGSLIYLLKFSLINEYFPFPLISSVLKNCGPNSPPFADCVGFEFHPFNIIIAVVLNYFLACLLSVLLSKKSKYF